MRPACCRDALNKDAKRLRVDLQDLRAFDADLGDQLERNPTEYLPLVRPPAASWVACCCVRRDTAHTGKLESAGFSCTCIATLDDWAVPR